MKEIEILEIEERCNFASPGPWTSFIEARDFECGSSFIMTGISANGPNDENARGEDIYLEGASNEDQDFIAHARQDIPKLISEIRRLKSK